ncbi:MAG: phosphoribosylformylglycinamidine cyclo-ligase [Desulfomicrobiaceae bacterium]|jgi:phosphoribosylformylglycinamidine cyclo-ligase|nr:phosphoribosylformylglycinamidine cyclo-ligase [Desulfomicrobiaceae bacterium]MDI3492474.1 phosphoribosylformylglycinamidine cyclo-ligase [Desulfomicrobiaceae bacterium]HCF06243.1 phosphoribosylformylglycinamidine cyclo-ligase [Desulfomicrobiaceae bacterium]
MEHRDQAYKAAGVDIQAGNALVERIKKHVASTRTKGVIGDLGGFGGLFKPVLANYRDPVFVAATDGVGTKLRIAWDLGRHDTIGIDLVAMNVNDIVVQGAKPLIFLDYFATGKLDVDVAEQVIAGIAEGCRQAGCALIGGETAEMPDFYRPGEYDLAGFCVGIVDNDRIVDGSSVGVGDVVIGLASSGVHSNGYSLVRKIVAESGARLQDPLADSDQSLGEALLTPTRIYVDTVLHLLRDFEIHAMAHITGGGFYDNIVRVLPRGTMAHITFGAWPVPPVFRWLRERGGLSWEEMLQIFNCGVGYVLMVKKTLAQEILDRLHALHCPGWIIGEVRERPEGAAAVHIAM